MRILHFALLALMVWQSLFSTSLMAQGSLDPCGGWSPLEPLFVNPDPTEVLDNLATSLVVDDQGQAHLAWLSFPLRIKDGSQDAFLYSRWDGESWTQPVDIFAASGTLRLGWPVLVPEPSGKLHIFWNTGSYIYHSWAWAEQADSAQAWMQPELVVSETEPDSAPIDVKLDTEGRFHLVFTKRTGDARYTYSDDGGQSWSAPVSVSSVGANVTTFVPKLSVTPEIGTIHVMWTEFPLSEGRSLRVNYARSVDGGNTWSDPLEMGSQFPSDGNVLAVDDGIVYVAWNGGVGGGGRYFRWSLDGGVTWSNVIRFSDRAGQSSFPSLALDSNNMLHILTGDGEYTSGDGQNLNPVCEFAPPYTERSRLAVVSGNQVLIVIPKTGGESVDFAFKNLPIPAIPTIAPSMVSSIAESTATATPVYTETPVGTSNGFTNSLQPFDRSDQSPQSSSSTPIVLATLSSGLVILLVILWKIRSRRP